MEHELRWTSWAPPASLCQESSHAAVALLLSTRDAVFSSESTVCTLQIAASDLYQMQHNTPTPWTGWCCTAFLAKTPRRCSRDSVRELSWLWKGVAQTPKQICTREFPKECPDLLLCRGKLEQSLLMQNFTAELWQWAA